MNDFPMPEVEDNEDLDLMKTFIESVKRIKESGEIVNPALVAEIEKQIDISLNPDVLSEQQQEEMMNILASGKPVITVKVIETLQDLIRKPGLVTVHYKMEGHDRRPFRGKMVCYAIRSADGDIVTLPKSARQYGKPITTRMPLTERRPLFTLSDNMARGPQDERWKNIVTRFSAAYTIIQQMAETMQAEKMILPGDAEPDRLAEVLHAEGNSETQETETVSGGVEETKVENTED